MVSLYGNGRRRGLCLGALGRFGSKVCEWVVIDDWRRFMCTINAILEFYRNFWKLYLVIGT